MSTKFKTTALRAFAAAAAFTLALTSFAPAAYAEEATVSTQEELRAAVDDAAVTKISLSSDIAMTQDWVPAVLVGGRSLVIEGNNHSIVGMKALTGVLKPDGTGEPGNGGSCDYYCGFFGETRGGSSLAVRNLTFREAEADIKTLSDELKSTGSSCIGTVVGICYGAVELENVAVENSVVRGYTKVGGFVGFNPPDASGKTVITKCAVRNTEIVLEKDASDPEAAFSGVIAGYGNGMVKTNGVILENNVTTVNSDVWDGLEVKTDTPGIKYIVDKNGTKWGLSSDTFTTDGYAMAAVQLPVSVDGYRYETLADAVAAAKNGDTVTVLTDLTPKQVSENGYLSLDSDGQNITIDLQGHTVTTAGADTIAVSAPNVGLTVKNGTILNQTEGSYGLYVYKTNDNVNVTFEGLTLDTVDQAVGVNGLNSNNNVTLRQCVVKSGVLGIYWPPKSGMLTLENTSVEAPSGLVVKGGSVSITGADTSVKANGPKVVPEDYYDGDPKKNLVCTGDAIYVESGYNDRDIDLKISAGTFLSENSNAIQYFQKEGESVTAKRSIQLVGGVYSTAPEAGFIADGFVVAPNEDGTYSVVASSGSAEEGGVSGEVVVQPSHPALKPVIKEEVGDKLASSAVDAGASLIENHKVAGMTVSDETSLVEVAKKVNTENGGTLETTLSFGLNLLEKAPADEAEVIEQSVAPTEKASFLDISVVLNVAAVDKDGKTIASASSGVAELDEPLEITVSVLDADLTGSVRLARVHEGTFEFIPCTVNAEAGTITFTTDRFSTYVLLTSNSVEVAFESNGGSAIEKQTVKYGEKVTKPADPTRDGFTFDAWYSDKELTKVFDFSKALDPKTEEPAMTLFAKWTEVEKPCPKPEQPIMHKVTFVPIVGGEEKIVVEVEDGKFVDLPKTPICKGYTFAGWFYDKDLKKPFKADENAITADLTLYGGWYKDNAKEPITPQKPSKPAHKPELPQTGDDSMIPIVALGLGGFAVIAAGVVLSRKSKK